MATKKIIYVCNSCGAEALKWQGQCYECKEWNTLTDLPLTSNKFNKAKGYSGSDVELKQLKDVSLVETNRFTTGILEFDRVLGGGIVPGSVILIGGDPGIGKSSLLLQVMVYLSMKHSSLYVTGEESLEQVALRAERMGLKSNDLTLLFETDVEEIVLAAKKVKPKVMVIDSIQTMQVVSMQCAPGGVVQVRESSAYLSQFAKKHQCAIFLVGHVTKSGDVAGPRVLEHIVDTVAFLEGQKDGRYRIMRSLKNRFGAVNEIGVFSMTAQGMKEVRNPSAIFLNRSDINISGSTIVSMWEGSRALLAEVQVLVDNSHGEHAKRVCVGVDGNRIAMLLAVLSKHAQTSFVGKDIFINIVGGVKVVETSVDLALVFSLYSSWKGVPIPKEWIVFGEVGLSGEIRPVPYGQERIMEAKKHGFKKAIVPFANTPPEDIPGICVVALKSISEAVKYMEVM